MEENDAIALAQAEDPVAFEYLYKTHRIHVLNHCKQILRNKEEAEDVTQEVFLLLLKKIKLFRFQCAFSTWLFRLTTNKCISHIRSRKARPQTEDCEIPEVMQLPDQYQRLEMLESLNHLSEMEQFCVQAEMDGNTLRYHGGANYLRSAAKSLRNGLQ